MHFVRNERRHPRSNRQRRFYKAVTMRTIKIIKSYDFCMIYYHTPNFVRASFFVPYDAYQNYVQIPVTFLTFHLYFCESKLYVIDNVN